METLGPWELFRRLGAGATAEVFLAAGPNVRGAELLALKVMLPGVSDARQTRETFLREARTSALLRHRHVVEIYEVGEIAGRPFIAMELVRGWSLAQIIKKLREAHESMGLDEACELVRQAALGLHYVHEVRGPQGQPLGLIHRDVSPHNLIVDEQGTLKVVDFGLVKATADQATHTTGLKGKLRYMAPEQLKGEGLDRRTDLFALGAVLFELACDRALHPGPGEAEIFQQAFFNPQPHPDEVKKGLPRALVEVLTRAIDRDQARRFQTGLAFAEALAPLAGVDVGGRVSARLLRHFERLPRSRAELEGPLAAPRAVRSRAPVPLPAPPGQIDRLGVSATEITEPAGLALGALRETLEALPGPNAAPATDASLRQTDAGAETEPAPPALRPPKAGARRAVGRLRPKAAATPRAAVAALVGVGALLSVSLMVAGFALARRLFPQRAVVEELRPAPPKWKNDLAETAPQPPRPAPTAAPTAAAQLPDPGAAAGEARPRAKPLAGRPPRRGGKGKVRFFTSEPAEVYVGKKRYGLSGDLLTLPSGRLQVDLIVPGGEKSAALEVDVVANTTLEKTVALEASR